MPNPNPTPALAEFTAATQALVNAAHALAANGVASDIAEGKKTFETTREQVSAALKVPVSKKA
jgi:hypothetical protein